MKKLSIIIGVIAFLAICVVSFYFIFQKDYTYYTRIDNTKIKEVESSGGVFDIHGGMKYEYNLTMYDENGTSKEIKFGTNRELRNEAFLKVKYYLISGVNKWEEVEYDDMPEKVQEKYNKI